MLFIFYYFISRLVSLPSMDLDGHQKLLDALREKCYACSYTIIIEWIADFIGIKPDDIDPDFYELDSDGIVFDMKNTPNNETQNAKVKKYLTLTAMESEKSFVPEECKKDEEAIKFISSLALNVNVVLNSIQKNLTSNKSLTPEQHDIIQSLGIRFDEKKYCFNLIFKNNAAVMHNQLQYQLMECKKIYERVDEKERQELDEITSLYQKDLETKFSIEEIKKNEDQLNVWREKYNSKCQLFICVEDAEDNAELEEQLLTRLEPVAPLLYQPETMNVGEKVKRTLDK